MVRKADSIPNFVKEFKQEFFSYSLNLSENEAQNLLQSSTELTNVQNQVLDEVIETCRTLRFQENDHINPDSMVFFRLRETILDRKTHILNQWRTRCGGKLPKVENHDELIATFQTLGVEAFPAFLLQERKIDHFLRGASIAFQHILGKTLKEQIITDTQLKMLFNVPGDTDMNTCCSYSTSTGHGGSVQLATFGDLVLLNSYYLMLLEGQDDIASYLEKIEVNVKLMRELAINKKVTVPVYVGYSNVAFPKKAFMEIPQGQLMSFDEKFLNLLPKDALPVTMDNERYAFVYKGIYSYTVEFQEKDSSGNIKWPKEFEQSRKNLDQIDEDIKLALSLSCKRSPVVSLSRLWTIIFDPLTFGVNCSWNSRTINPTPCYKCTEDEIIAMEEWSKTIYVTDDSKIRLAIRKTLSAISDRQNPVDAFIDGIISWENLFGANAELSFRISSSIACLLEGDKSKRNILYKKLKKTYDIRSQIVHGVKELDYEQAIELRDFALEISLACISKLFVQFPDLIENPERSLTILLEHE